jgi:superfamily II DNA/RNA helicase
LKDKFGKQGRPTEIQTEVIPQMLQGENVMCVSHTGSGKTLAYLLPAVHLMKRAEEREKKELRAQFRSAMRRRPGRPRVLVLCPTRELVQQVTSVGKDICHHAKFRVCEASGANTWAQHKKDLDKGLDMLVSTPSRVLQLVESGLLATIELECVVVDEVYMYICINT